LGDRPANQHRAAHHHRALAGKVAQHLPQQDHAAERRAGVKSGKAAGQAAGVHDMQAVDVLVRADGGDHHLVVEMLGQRQLDQDAVD